MSLTGFVVRRLVRDARRSLATLLAVLLAVTSFVLLTGSARTQKLSVTATVQENFRSAYDILVRPGGSALELEQTQGVVRPNSLSGTYGGISAAQVARLRQISGVEVAAPIAMVGTVLRRVPANVDVTKALNGRQQVLLRYSSLVTARNSSVKIPGTSGYVFLTRYRIASDQSGRDRSQVNGKSVTVCFMDEQVAAPRPSSPQALWHPQCESTQPRFAQDTAHSRFSLTAWLSIPMLVAAVDPAAEDALVGLSGSMVSGRALAGADGWAFVRDDMGRSRPTVTAVIANSQPSDYQVTLRAEELPSAVMAPLFAATTSSEQRHIIAAAPSTRVVVQRRFDAADVYARQVANPYGWTASEALRNSLSVSTLIRQGDVRYTGTTTLSPLVVPSDPSIWLQTPRLYDDVPLTVDDTGYRTVTTHRRAAESARSTDFAVVGRYDPARIRRGHSALVQVPLETYEAVTLTGANDASRRVLGERPMRSDLNPAGYLQAPPTLLIPLNALPAFRGLSGVSLTAPISAVRVRVAGVTGLDEADRERIRLVAQAIHEVTGLTVDITVGSSLQQRTINLPATVQGSPALSVTEMWTKKGVAVAVVDAVDTKSVLMVILMLVSAALTVAISSSAAVTARSTELGILSCVGWTPRRIVTSVLLELAVLGTTAGTVGGLLAFPLARVAHVSYDVSRAILAVPVAVALTVLAGAASAARAGRAAPRDTMVPALTTGARVLQIPLVGPATLGLHNLLRRRFRLVVGTVSVALAVTSTSLLLGIMTAFKGAVVGSLLGDVVAVQVRPPDLVATVCLVVLGVTTVGVVLTLGVDEDRVTYAVLSAQGWRPARLAATVVAQAAILASLGALIGAGAALLLLSALTGGLALSVWGMTVAVAAGVLVLALAVSLVPAARVGRLSPASILSAD